MLVIILANQALKVDYFKIFMTQICPDRIIMLRTTQNRCNRTRTLAEVSGKNPRKHPAARIQASQPADLN